MLVQGMIIAGALYASLKIYKRSRKKRTDLQISSSEAKQKKKPLLSVIDKTDEKFQTFMHQKVDPLFGGKRHQQLAKLAQHPEVVDEAEKTLNRQIAFSTALTGVAVLGAWFFPPLLLFSAVAGFYMLFPLYEEIYFSLTKERRIKQDFVIGLYMAGMLLQGVYILIAVSCLLYFIGSKLIYRTEQRSREELVNVFGQQPRFVWRLIEGTEIEIPVEELLPGDLIVVNAGEVVPVDGMIAEGIGLVDQHALTGEAQPVEKEQGDSVLASTLLLTGRIIIEVEKAGSQTAVAQIGEILNEMSNYRMSIESKGTELGDKAALPVLMLSGLALPLVGKIGATTVLGSSFGSNMRIIAPICMLNFLNLASRSGVLVKDGKALERLQGVDTFVFDKTGTLTLEQPHVVQIHIHNNLTENELLIYAAAAEFRQTHPIAKAILQAADERGLELPSIDEARYEVGYGIKVEIDNQIIRVGSERFLTLEGIEIPAEIKKLKSDCQHQGHSLVMVAIENELAGALELRASIRPEAKEVIQHLQKYNLSVSIISGDQEEPTRALAQELGIDGYFANTLPENKAELIKQLQEAGHSVCFVGDGINDAIALKQADVSISLLGATTVAIDTAQIVLMDQSLKQLVYLLDLAKEFDKTIQTAFITTLLPGAVCIGGVFFLGFGLVASEVLYQIGLYSGLGVAMKPILTQKKIETDDNIQ